MEIRYFRRDETVQVQNAIHSVCSKKSYSISELKLLNYMFYENPAKRHWIDNDYYSFLGAWVEDKLVGLLGVMPFEVNDKGKNGMGCSLTNWIVLPKYRNSGAGIALFYQCKNTSHYSYYLLESTKR